MTESELLDCIADYDGVIAGDDEFTEQVFESAENLRMISKWGIGTDNIDKEAAAKRDIAVYNTPGVFDDEVADVVVGYAIMLTRKLHRIDRDVQAGEWSCPRGTSLAGKTFGVVGVGNIGSTVARRASALGMDVLGYDVRSLPAELVADTDIKSVTKDRLFEDATIVSLNCPLTSDTRQMVGHDELAKLGPEGYLINTARGKLVDQSALIDALETGRIAGAALDVYEREPLPPESPLTELDNVVLGSHNAQNTTEAVERVNRQAIENLLEGLSERDQP